MPLLQRPQCVLDRRRAELAHVPSPREISIQGEDDPNTPPPSPFQAEIFQDAGSGVPRMGTGIDGTQMPNTCPQAVDAEEAADAVCSSF